MRADERDETTAGPLPPEDGRDDPTAPPASPPARDPRALDAVVSGTPGHTATSASDAIAPDTPGDGAGSTPAAPTAGTGDHPTAAAPAQPGAADEAAVPASEPAAATGRRLALSTAFFSFATGLSRVAGLVREVAAASYFGVSAQMSAFTIAFQVPNLLRALFADAALQGAFVPVFTELLEKGQRREAFRVASALFFLICLLLGGLTIVFALVAPVVMPLFSPGFAHSPQLEHLTVQLSRLMFPTVLLVAVTGIVVGMLNSLDHFSVPALAPIAWNGVIIAGLIGLGPFFPTGQRVYAYAIGVVAGTVVQLLLPIPWLRARGVRFDLSLDFRNPHVLRVLKLMAPVTLALGLINFSALVNSQIGTLVSDQAPAAIDKAFRIYMLPQGIFSVAVATILFPTMSRFAARSAYDELRRTMANGLRQICLLLIPSAALMAVLAVPITRLVYQRGAFGAGATDLVSTAMFWWAFSLPFQGMSLLLSRTFFSLRRTWVTTALAAGNIVVNAVVAFLLYAPFGVAGIVLGTVIGTVGMTIAQALLLRPVLGGIEGRRTLGAGARMLVAAVPLSIVAYVVWRLLDEALGRALTAQAVSVGGGILAGSVAYAIAVLALRVREARQIVGLLGGRFARNRGGAAAGERGAAADAEPGAAADGGGGGTAGGGSGGAADGGPERP